MNAWILAFEAFAVYGLVLWSHSLRHRFGLAFFYALLGSLTAIMSWVTDAGVAVKVGDITFLVGSTVFYTSLLLGVFVVYVFDGPRATRVAILTVVGVSALAPIISLVLHLQTQLSSTQPLGTIPMPNLRINLASLLTTLADLVFLAVSWEFFHGKFREVPLAVKSFLTLLGVMWLDVVLFNTGAFFGQPGYLSIMSGTLLSRLIITFFAAPILWAYLSWQSALPGVTMPHRPVLAILRELTELQVELATAREEIQRRREAEAQLIKSEKRYRQLLANASEPIAVIHRGLYALYNTRLLELTGLTDQDMLTAAAFQDFVHPSERERLEDTVSQALRHQGEALSVEFRAVTARGEVMHVQANMVGIDWDGERAVLAFLHDTTEQRRTVRRLETEATHDALTGTLNRRGFSDNFEQAAMRMDARRQPYCVLYLDVDQFKSINDLHGHAAGDMVLKAVAQAIRSQVREGDLIGRMGGDEFAVMLAGADAQEAKAVAGRILEKVCSACSGGGEGPQGVSVSIGFAQNREGENSSPFELLERADRALLEAKRAGRNTVRGDDPA